MAQSLSAPPNRAYNEEHERRRRWQAVLIHLEWPIFFGPRDEATSRLRTSRDREIARPDRIGQ